jgi:hypothetical protein
MKGLTVASENKEFILVSQLVLLDVREGSNNLALRRQLSNLFELKVTNGARQGQVAIDTAKVYKSTGGSDSVLFGLELRLVVFGQGFRAALDAQDTS